MPFFHCLCPVLTFAALARLYLPVPAGQGSNPTYYRPPDGSLRFTHEGVAYLFYDRAAPLATAIFRCHSNPNMPGGTGRLLTVDQVGRGSGSSNSNCVMRVIGC